MKTYRLVVAPVMTVVISTVLIVWGAVDSEPVLIWLGVGLITVIVVGLVILAARGGRPLNEPADPPIWRRRRP